MKSIERNQFDSDECPFRLLTASGLLFGAELNMLIMPATLGALNVQYNIPLILPETSKLLSIYV